MESTNKTPQHIRVGQTVYKIIELSNDFQDIHLKELILGELENQKGNISIGDYCSIIMTQFKGIEDSFKQKDNECGIIGEKIYTEIIPYKAQFEYIHIDGSFGGYDTLRISIVRERLELILNALDSIKSDAEHKLSQTQQPRAGIEPIPDASTPQLPKELDTPEANRIFAKAVEVGLMEQQGNGYKWHKTKNLLAYFADKMSEHFNLGKGEYDGKRKIAWKPFETIFNTNGLSGAKRDYQRDGKLPSESKIVDNLF